VVGWLLFTPIMIIDDDGSLFVTLNYIYIYFPPPRRWRSIRII